MLESNVRHLKTLRSQVESRLKEKIEDGSAMLQWLVVWAAEVLNKYVTHKGLIEAIVDLSQTHRIHNECECNNPPPSCIRRGHCLGQGWGGVN